MISAALVISTAVIMFMIGGSIASYHYRLTKVSACFLIPSFILFAWAVAASFGPIVGTDSHYYPVFRDGYNEDYVDVDGDIINITKKIGMIVPNGSRVRVRKYRKSWLGLRYYVPNRYDVELPGQSI